MSSKCCSLVVWAIIFLQVPAGLHGLNSTESTGPRRRGKVFSVFQIIKFSNDPCNTGATRNGTCYTQAECTDKGGSSIGNCAAGYGVCCVFSLACGGMSSQNCTYLTQTSITNTLMNPCQYTICPCDEHICRIRFDFTSFNINGPVEGTAANVAGPITEGGAIGDCTRDTFTITAPNNFAPPLICGFNTGQHMIVDACPNECHEAVFGFSGTGTRSWNIKVTQYQCGDEQGGPEGCLQYFTGTMGTVASFNFPTASAVVDPSTTHLSNQCYTMCWRQNENICAICWIPVVLGSDTVSGSFGLSLSGGVANPRGEAGGKCRTDFLQIPDAQVNVAGSPDDTFIIGSIPQVTNIVDRVCGRYFSSADSAGDRRSSLSICTQQRPFRMTFKTDGDEVTTGPTSTRADVNEVNKIPGGIVGFNLAWKLQSCT